MFNVPTAQTFAAASAPLISSFGDALTLWRDGNVVHWSYDGQTVTIELQPDGTVDATFTDRTAADLVGGGETAAVYRCRASRAYRLTGGGSDAMVADMMAFFSGDREPQFDFTGFR